MPRFFAITSILFLLFLSASAYGQTVQDEYLEEEIEVRKFDEEKWQTLREDIDYSDEKKDEEEEPEEEVQKPSSESEKSNQGAGVFEILKYFVIIGAIVLVIFLLVKLLGNDSPKNRKVKSVSQMELEEIEENLEETELDDPIRRAIAASDFNLAIRLYYLALLKELSGKRFIRWKRDKTNGEYIRELSGHSFSETFREVTLIFERVWYGTVEINKSDFLLVEKEFKTAIGTVERQAPVE